MGPILMRAACFIMVIILGHLLRRIGFFKEDDFHVLSKIVLKITLPASIITSVAGREIQPLHAGNLPAWIWRRSVVYGYSVHPEPACIQRKTSV